jgi:Tat protein translocase TatB subunit
MFNVGPTELLVILILALVVFGPNKLPEMSRQIGRGLREFRRVTQDVQNELQGALHLDDDDEDDDEPATPVSSNGFGSATAHTETPAPGPSGASDGRASGEVRRASNGSGAEGHTVIDPNGD